jgi:hypothetical protein
VLTLPAEATTAELRRLQRRRSLAVAGFRAGRVPQGLFYRTHRQPIDDHMIRMVRRDLPGALQDELQQAAVPPEYTARGLGANGGFEIEVAWFSLPQAPDPRGRFGELAGSAPGAGPELPSLRHAPLEAYLPKVETPAMAEHNLALGRQLNTGRQAPGPSTPTPGMAGVQQGPAGPSRPASGAAPEPTPPAAEPARPQPIPPGLAGAPPEKPAVEPSVPRRTIRKSKP